MLVKISCCLKWLLAAWCLAPSLSRANTSHPIPLRAVILIDDAEALVHEGLSTYNGVIIRSRSVPGNPSRLKKHLATALLGAPIDGDTMKRGEEIIRTFYRKAGHPLVIVSVPEQKISQGTLQFVVRESRVDAIQYEGNRWFSTDQLKKQVRQPAGKPFNANRMQKDLIWLNRNPFRETVLVLTPGTEEETTTLHLVSKDSFPYRIYFGADNTGYRTTGLERLFIGVHFGNLFKRDQRLSYRYTVSPRFGRFFAHTTQYVAPLPWRHILELYGGYSGIRAIMPGSRQVSKGKAWQASLRYLIPLFPVQSYNHEITWGIDYKETNVNLVLAAVPILGNNAVITQAMCGYSASLENPVADLSFGFEAFFSPGNIFRDQSSADFSSLRPDSKSSYTYVRAKFTPLFHLPHSLQLVVRSEFQVASRNLLSSEQLGLGGLYTVRGYDERIVNADNGLFLLTELRSPPLRPLTKLFKKKSHELLQFLAFLDYGFGTNDKSVANERNYRYLLGTGVGARYYYDYYVNARVDVGYPLHRHIAPNITQPAGVKINFSAIIGF